MNNRNAVTVSQLNELVKMTLDSSEFLSFIYVRGEISNFTNHFRTGHLYFSLKDESSTVKAVMFSSHTSKLKFVPKDGMRVLVCGRVSSYAPTGQYQIYIDEMEPDGIGSLAVAFEERKSRLAPEGLFHESHKKPLPPFPARIGIITSPTGAAVRDIINVSTRRNPGIELILFPSQVQGEGSAMQLASGIRYFNKTKLCDLIIIGRGGGSMEDLWEFNDESLVRTIYHSEIPVISAVGHEIDYTLCDFVADMRAPTPSAAAELAIPDRLAIKESLSKYVLNMRNALQNKIHKERVQLTSYSGKPCLQKSTYYVDEKRMTLDSYSRQLDRFMAAKLNDTRNRLDLLTFSMEHAQNHCFEKQKSLFDTLQAKLHALSPLGVFRRGYSAVLDDNRQVLRSVHDLQKSQEVHILLADGSANAKITDIRKESQDG